VEELPDYLVKALVDALDPSLGVISEAEMKDLLRKYVNCDTLPSLHCLHSILFNIYNRGYKSSDNPALRQLTNMHYVAHLLEKDDADRSLYLRLITVSSSVYGRDSVIDADLSRSLFHLLDRPPKLHGTLLIELLDTIYYSPTICYAHDEPIIRLAKVYEKQTSKRISRAAVAAIASFSEFIFRSYSPSFDSHDFDVTKQTQFAVRIVAGKLVHLLDASIGDEIVVFSIYVLSMASGHVNVALATTPIDELLSTLVNVLCVPNSNLQVAIVHHTIQIIRSIIDANRSTALLLAESAPIFEQLAINSDPRVRWPSCGIILSISFFLHRDERVRIFETISVDIHAHLRSASNPFIDPNWKSLMDLVNPSGGKLESPLKVALVQEIMGDLQQSGIIELLEGASRAMVCERSALIPDDFFWLPSIHTEADEQ